MSVSQRTQGVTDVELHRQRVGEGPPVVLGHGGPGIGHTYLRQGMDELAEAGFELTMDDVIREAGDADSIGRPHIAKAAGATKETMNAFFEEWLVPNGGKAFVSRKWPSALEAVELIHGAGGAAVLAHPFWDIEQPNEVLALIDDLDLDGVETFYPSHTREQTKFLLDVCADRNLAATGSSDFHGPSHKIFSRFGAYPTYELGEPELPPTPAA
jgi:predicted metal-dependent phosphoesterase TrpH